MSCAPPLLKPAIDTQRQQTLTRRGRAPCGSHGFSVTQTYEAGGQKAAVRRTGAASKRALAVCARFLSAFLCAVPALWPSLGWTPWQENKTLRDVDVSVIFHPSPPEGGSEHTVPRATRHGLVLRGERQRQPGVLTACRAARKRLVLCAHSECLIAFYCIV